MEDNRIIINRRGFMAESAAAGEALAAPSIALAQ
jgi:hypothetical protein